MSGGKIGRKDAPEVCSHRSGISNIWLDYLMPIFKGLAKIIIGAIKVHHRLNFGGDIPRSCIHTHKHEKNSYTIKLAWMSVLVV